MMDDIQKSIQERYAHVHPLIFQRSLERARTNGELFDILETIPEEFPISWCEVKRKWQHTDDLLQNEQYKSL